MRNAILLVGVTVYLALDTAIALRSGKAPGPFHKYLRYRFTFGYGPITREGRPRLYWNYVYGYVTLLAVFVLYFAWLLFSPKTSSF